MAAKRAVAWGGVACALALGASQAAACGADDEGRTDASAPIAEGGVIFPPISDASTPDAAVSDADAAVGHTLTLGLRRGAGNITVTVRVLSSGTLDGSQTPVLTVAGGTASALTPTATAGEFQGTITPSGVDLEVPITASAHGATITRTALMLSNIDDSLDQPEAVPGLVNTEGVEDGINVSPDGQWLLVGTYSPVDVYTCAAGGFTYATPACAAIVGPYGAPERPSMLGASRIQGGTYTNGCPSVGLLPPQTYAFIPVAAYMFRRAADGTFGEPHVIGAGADGCLGPYGYSFAASPVGNSAKLLFSQDDPFDAPDTKADIYFLDAVLGQDNIWATYSLQNGAAKVSDMKAVRIAPTLAARQGNPAYANGILAWDDEDQEESARRLFFAPLSGTLPTVTAADAGPVGDAGAQVIAIPQAGEEQIQPAFDGDDLYWFGANGISRSSNLDGGALSASSSWSPRKVMLAPGTSANRPILAVGEPTVARLPDGGKELYFVYVKKTAKGLDGAVGRVRFR